MVNTATKFIAAFGFLSAVSNAFADHPTLAFGSEAAGTINTISAETMPQGEWGFGVRTERIRNKSFNSEQLEGFALQGLEGIHSVDKIINTSLSFAYGVSEKLMLMARLPHIQRTNIRESELELGVPEAHVHGDSSGLGDLSVFSQYRAFKNEHTDASILLGLKAPTGTTDVRDIEGVRFETEFQPGTGSWDAQFGAAVARKIGKAGLHASILFNKTTEGSQSTRLGDAWFYSAALSYRLGGEDHSHHDHAHDRGAGSHGLSLNLLLELNGETRSQDKVAGVSEANSGGTTVYLSPGVKVSLGNGLGGFLSIGIPVLKDHNGTQTEAELRMVAGLSLAL